MNTKNKITTYKGFTITEVANRGPFIVRLPTGQIQALSPSLTIEDIHGAIDDMTPKDFVIRVPKEPRKPEKQDGHKDK